MVKLCNFHHIPISILKTKDFTVPWHKGLEHRLLVRQRQVASRPQTMGKMCVLIGKIGKSWFNGFWMVSLLPKGIATPHVFGSPIFLRIERGQCSFPACFCILDHIGMSLAIRLHRHGFPSEGETRSRYPVAVQSSRTSFSKLWDLNDAIAKEWRGVLLWSSLGFHLL